MSINDLKKQVDARVAEEEAQAPAVEAQPLDEHFILECLRANRVGDARLYNTLHKGKFVFVKRWGRWLTWAGHHWAEDIMGLATAAVEKVCEEYLRVAAATSRDIEGEDNKDVKRGLESRLEALRKRISLLRDVGGRDRLLECCHNIDDPLAITGDELDQQPYLLAFKNGVVDLRTGEFRSGRPEDYILNASPIGWTGIETPCKEWEKFLLSCHELCPDGPEAMLNFLRRALGYGIMADRRDHVFLVFVGDKGRNGKDTCMKIICKVLGQALSNDIPVEMLLTTSQQRSSSAPSPDIMALRGMRIAWSNEPDKASQFAMGKLKKLTGGSTLTARGLQDKLMTSWTPTHLLVLLTNEVPRAVSEDTAFWGRMLVVRWLLRFVDNPTAEDERPVDKDLYQKLLKELPGIAAWLVRGCLEYLQSGLNPPPSVLSDTLAERDKNDVVGQFLREACEFEDLSGGGPPTWRITAGDFYDAFCVWNRNYKFGSRNFGIILGKKGIDKKKSGGNVYLGVRLTDAMLEDIEKHRRGKKGSGDEDDDKDRTKSKEPKLF